MTIPIEDAIRAVKFHIAMCDAATFAWDGATVTVKSDGVRITSSEDAVFALAARAGYKATLEYVLGSCLIFNAGTSIDADWPLYPAVRPLIEHLDATRPGWRTE